MAGNSYDKMRSLMGKGGGGVNFRALDFTRLEEKHEFYKPKLGGQRIDILPFKVGRKHPYVAKGQLSEGDAFYTLPVYIHKDIGVSRRTVICPKRNYGRPCPICEMADEMQKEAKTEAEKQAVPYARLRLFYNVVDRDDEAKGVQIFDTNNKDFEKPLKAAQDDADAEAGKAGEALRFFADPENGLTVKIIGADDTFNGNKFVKISSVSLVPRRGDVTDYLDDVVQLDRLIDEPSYDELVALMNGVEEEEAESEAPTKPTPKVERAVETKAAPADDTPTCPVKGGVFGKDDDKYDECEDCKLWRACVKAHK